MSLECQQGGHELCAGDPWGSLCACPCHDWRHHDEATR